MNTTSEMTDALKQTLVIRVPVVVRHEEEMDYDRFCEEYMSAEDDEDSPTLEKRCRETWEALITLYNRGNGYVDLEEIDGGECDEGNVLNEYTDASDAFQDVVEDAVGDLKRHREHEATREEREAAGKAAKQKMLEERKQKAKEAEEFAAWKKAMEEKAEETERARFVEEMRAFKTTMEAIEGNTTRVVVPPPVKVEVPVSERGVDILVTALKCALTRIAELEQRVKELTEGI